MIIQDFMKPHIDRIKLKDGNILECLIALTEEINKMVIKEV
jgi:hypothetical protein